MPTISVLLQINSTTGLLLESLCKLSTLSKQTFLIIRVSDIQVAIFCLSKRTLIIACQFLGVIGKERDTCSFQWMDTTSNTVKVTLGFNQGILCSLPFCLKNFETYWQLQYSDSSIELEMSP